MVLVEREAAAPTLNDRLALQALWCGTTPDGLPDAEKRRAVEGFYGLRWQGFEIVGQNRNESIIVVDYDPEWPERFQSWRKRLDAALGGEAMRIDHVGSTAVPGLAAKPIIDIQVSLPDIANESRYVPAIEEIGVALRSRDGEHRYFRPPPERPRDVQIHVCDIDGDWERDHLRFRDHLRSHNQDREAYAALKRQLARRFPQDRLAYTEGKSEFIAEVLSRRST